MKNIIKYPNSTFRTEIITIDLLKKKKKSKDSQNGGGMESQSSEKVNKQLQAEWGRVICSRQV